MNTILLGLGVSFLTCIGLSVLFSYERRRGARFGERFRASADFFVIKLHYAMRTLFQPVRKETIRQTFHYFFHQILSGFLKLTKYVEELLHRTMHINKKLAKTSEKDATVKSKLDELSLHKAATAMTPAEKKKRKEKALEQGS